MRSILTFFIALSLAGPARPADRDWVKYPAVVQFDTSAEIFAIGDAHSDYTRLALAMHAAGLIAGVPKQPENVQWNGGNSVLVTTGDMIDKGPRALDVLRLLRSLQASRPGDRADA